MICLRIVSGAQVLRFVHGLGNEKIQNGVLQRRREYGYCLTLVCVDDLALCAELEED